MRKKCEADSYRSHEEFLVDLNQIVDNSITYNGPTSPFTVTAQSMRKVGLQYLEEEREHFEQYESQLGPFDKSPLNEPEGLGGESGDEEAEEEDTSTNMNITGQSSVIITSEDSIQIMSPSAIHLLDPLLTVNSNINTTEHLRVITFTSTGLYASGTTYQPLTSQHLHIN
uniref:Bromo domain-containing protein n=1 Tax=Amphimedon queenslandica TaxID=400682 RepID=A0A1X7UGD5_AMPQE